MKRLETQLPTRILSAICWCRRPFHWRFRKLPHRLHRLWWGSSQLAPGCNNQWEFHILKWYCTFKAIFWGHIPWNLALERETLPGMWFIVYFILYILHIKWHVFGHVWKKTCAHFDKIYPPHPFADQTSSIAMQHLNLHAIFSLKPPIKNWFSIPITIYVWLPEGRYWFTRIHIQYIYAYSTYTHIYTYTVCVRIYIYVYIMHYNVICWYADIPDTSVNKKNHLPHRNCPFNRHLHGSA